MEVVQLHTRDQKMLIPVSFRTLPSVRQILSDTDTLFIIPTFQRPYAWEERQIVDLKKDFESALNALPRRHYFAHAHLVPIERAGAAISEFLDRKTDDIVIAQAQARNIPSTYAVIDGQQRLVTLYLLSIMQELILPSGVLACPFPNLFQVILPNNTVLPRIILGTSADHIFFRTIVDWLFNQNPGMITAAQIEQHIQGLPIAPHQPSQNRLRETILLLLKYFFIAAPHGAAGLIAGRDIKLGLTELDADYALTSFITLNDRGKSLTTLEKLKALWLQRAIATAKGHLVGPIHVIFGELYRAADSCVHVGLASKLRDAEDLIVQVLYHWLDMENPTHQLWSGAEKVYEWFVDLNAPWPVSAWVNAASELHAQLEHLCTVYLERTSLLAQQASIHFPKTSTLYCDYHSLLVKIKVPHHLLALLLRFRQLHPGHEWHERFPLLLAFNPLLAQPICDLLREEADELDSLGIECNLLKDRCAEIRGTLPVNCSPLPKQLDSPVKCVHKSILEAIERISVLAWMENSDPRAGFIRGCAATFGPAYTPKDFVSTWYAFCNSSGPYDSWYIDKLCNQNAPVSQDYLLYEWERELVENAPNVNATGSQYDCLAPDQCIELEHILPAAWDLTIQRNAQTFIQWGFRDFTDFQRNMLERIGNKAILWSSCNKSVGHDHPYIKVTHYTGATCRHTPNAPSLKQISRVGQDIAGLGVGPSPMFRIYFRLRCAELASFALRRLC